MFVFDWKCVSKTEVRNSIFSCLFRSFLVSFDLFPASLCFFRWILLFCIWKKRNKFRRIKKLVERQCPKISQVFFFRCVSSGNRNDLSINIKLVKSRWRTETANRKIRKNTLSLRINIDTHVCISTLDDSDWLKSIHWADSFAGAFFCVSFGLVWLRYCRFGDNLLYTHSCAMRCMHMHACMGLAGDRKSDHQWKWKRKAHIECKSRSTTDHHNRSSPSESSP